MFALIDANNFYVSCERVFRPALQNCPVIVLSNNDGCAISRSDEARDLGVAMGQPYFEIEKKFANTGLIALSANFVLYGDMSSRLMGVAAALGPSQEIYSIDECFIDLAGVRGDLTRRAQIIRRRIFNCLGLPTCIGIGPTKTLAKLANYVAKSAYRKPGSYPAEFSFVCNLAALSVVDFQAVLAATPVAEVWGVGRRLAAQLQTAGVLTALDLANLPSSLVRSRWSVVLERTVRELQGQPCLALEDVSTAKQQIACTRSFGSRLHDLSDLIEAITHFASRAAEKLRQQNSMALQVFVFIHTSPFSGEKQYAQSVTVRLLQASSDTLVIVQAAIQGLRRIYQSGYAFAKAGVVLMDLFPREAVLAMGAELDLFDDLQSKKIGRSRSDLMLAVDEINAKFGKGALRVATAGTGQKNQAWQMRQALRTPNYTTCLTDIPVARA